MIFVAVFIAGWHDESKSGLDPDLEGRIKHIKEKDFDRVYLAAALREFRAHPDRLLAKTGRAWIGPDYFTNTRWDTSGLWLLYGLSVLGMAAAVGCKRYSEVLLLASAIFAFWLARVVALPFERVMVPSLPLLCLLSGAVILPIKALLKANARKQ